MKKCILFFVAIAALVVFAEPTVTINRVAQRYPWNGLVDIDYTLTGLDDSASYLVEFACSGKRQDGEPFSVAADTFLSAISTENGTHRATWDANADGADFFAKGAQMTAVVRFKPIKTDGDYMIVDLTGGTNAAVWRVTYMSDVADPAATFNTDEYKTTKLVLKKVKAGSFWMGSESDPESEFYDDMGTYDNDDVGENPRHYVTLTKDYFIGLFKLTSAQYEAIVGEKTAYDAANSSDKPMVPATGISRNELNPNAAFFTSLNGRTACMGQARPNFNLPTEAQWERAVRAGRTTRFFFGDDGANLADYAWYSTSKPPQNVGLLKPNPWGLYDVYGNALEHVRDTTGAYSAGTEQNPVVDPMTTGGWGAIHRSSATWSSANDSRSATRKSATRSAAGGGSYGVRLIYQCD